MICIEYTARMYHFSSMHFSIFDGYVSLEFCKIFSNLNIIRREH
jgi:hypothetical protein